MVDRFREVRGVRVPTFLYGTAWKEDATQRLVERALAAGFRGIDTANQRRHYDEAAVGRGVAAALARGEARRDELFFQTKYTFRAGQDHRLPYDAGAPVGDQVRQSVASSLDHLGIDAVDSYVLHGPSRGRGLGPEDREAWQAMEEQHDAGRARLLGVSNVRPDQLEALCAAARVMPAFVQNRCYAQLGWDAEVREICARRGLVYQGFSLLTANPAVVTGHAVGAIASRHGRTPAQVVFRFCLQLGMVVLTGTTDAAHMEEDLGAYALELDVGEMRAIRAADAD
jgi:diketogulonate reductase-like aldo/keto reductase